MGMDFTPATPAFEDMRDGMLAATLDPKPASFADPAFWATRDQAHVAKVIKEGGKSVGKSETMAAYGRDEMGVSGRGVRYGLLLERLRP